MLKNERQCEKKNKEWFDQDCEALYRNLKSVARSLTNYCNVANKLSIYYTLQLLQMMIRYRT